MRTWVLAAVAAAGFLAGLEAFWRARGHAPSVVDTPTLWSRERRKIEQALPDAVVLLGSSRMQLDFSSEVFRSAYGARHALVRLEIDGRHPMAALRDVAENTPFAGLVICDVNAGSFQPDAWDGQQEYVEYYHRRLTLNGLVNREAATFVQSRLAMVNPHLSSIAVTRFLVRRRRLPEPMYLITRADRSREADYGKLDIQAHRAERISRVRAGYGRGPALAPEEWLCQALAVEPFVERIQARGGRVAFVRLPVSGEHLELDEARWPRALYWDRFAAATRATTLDFRDLPGGAGFDCPDTSHLNYGDARRFTDLLLDELARQGIGHRS